MLGGKTLFVAGDEYHSCAVVKDQDQDQDQVQREDRPVRPARRPEPDEPDEPETSPRQRQARQASGQWAWTERQLAVGNGQLAIGNRKMGEVHSTPAGDPGGGGASSARFSQRG